MSNVQQQTKNPPSSTVYARNLPYDVTEDEIRIFFSPAGTPSRIALNNDRETGRFRGVAFVSFPSIDIAESAVRNLNKSPLKGREIYLDFSKERERRHHHRHDGGSNAQHAPGPPELLSAMPPPQNGAVHSAQPPVGPPGYSSVQPGMAYPGGPGQAMAPQQGQIMFPAPNQPPFNQAGMMGQTIILSADGQILSGAPPGGGLVMAGGAPVQVQGTADGAPPQLAAPPQAMMIQTQAPTSHDRPPGPPQPMDGAPQSLPVGLTPVPPSGVQIPAHVVSARAPHELQMDLPVGMPTAQHASQQLAKALGHPQSANAPSQQATTSTISGMSPKQLFKILRELKAQMQADPEKGRKVLRDNLPLTKALFQAQILLGMVNPDQPPIGQPPQAQASKGDGHVPSQHLPNSQSRPAAPTREAPPTQTSAAPQNSAGAGPVEMDSAKLDMLKKIMRLDADAISKLSDSQRSQVENLRRFAMQHNIGA